MSCSAGVGDVIEQPYAKKTSLEMGGGTRTSAVDPPREILSLGKDVAVGENSLSV